MNYAPLFIQESPFTLRRRRLRRDATKAEEVLWRELRNRKLGYKFRRQFSVGEYIVDFYCPELKFVIELDGPVHNDEAQKAYDARRTQFLENEGNYVLRFLNDEVLFEREKAVEKILVICKSLRK
ncbi:MAG: endonuclease domain-containing protein [Patescibacteria group bacterium]